MCFDILNNTVEVSDVIFPIKFSNAGYSTNGDSGFIFGGLKEGSALPIDNSYCGELLKTTIYYTVDGSDPVDSSNVPTANAKKYEGPFTLELAATVLAVCVPFI